jgi:hypothetical protein
VFFTALFNDNLIYPVLQFSVLFIGIFTGFLLWFISGSIYVAIICAMISFSIASIIMNVIHSAIISLFVCCAENLNILSTLRPELYNEIMLCEVDIRQRNSFV